MEKRINLQTRDLLLFRRLCEFGYLTLSQIADLVFKAPYKKTSRRLVLLREKGFIRFIWRRDYLGSRVYIPDIRNLQGTMEDEIHQHGVKIAELKPWFRSLHEHEDKVREAALKFLDAFPLTAAVELDHQLKPEDWGYYGDEDAKRKVPDFVLYIDGMPKIAIEIELTAKSSDRYEEIFHHIIRYDKAHFIYLVDRESLEKKITGIVRTRIHCLKESERPDHKLIAVQLNQINSQVGVWDLIDRLKPESQRTRIQPSINNYKAEREKSLSQILHGDSNGDCGDLREDQSGDSTGAHYGEFGDDRFPRRRRLSDLIK